MFVASFLGNPPINYIGGRIETAGGGSQFHRGDWRIALPPALAARAPASAGREVVLGLRPEDVLPARSGGPTLSGVVDSVLPIGSDRFLGFKLEGSQIFVRVGKETHHRAGERVTLDLVPERLHLFDRQSGLNLLAEPGP